MRVHGKSPSLYGEGCRCDACRKCQNERVARNRAARRENIKTHGIRSSYDAGCRCDECRAARYESYQRLDSERTPWQKLRKLIAATGNCPASDTGGHCYHNQDGTWACCLCQPEAVA